MPRARTGSVETRRRTNGSTYYRVRLRLADGSRARVDVPKRYATDEDAAELYALAIQEREDETGEHLAAKTKRAAEAAKRSDPRHGATWDAWFERYLPTKDCGEGHRRISKDVASKWISPVIGSKPIATLTRDDVEDVRDKLDRALDAKTIRHSTARNAWAVFTSALKAASASRDRSLRVHAAPLHFGVLPPKRGEARQRPWLYPREWSALVECAAVPVAFRQACAIALYTGLRPGELRALTWADVDLEARTISVSKAWDAHIREVKAPKTAAGQRIIPIQAALFPLLDSLAADDEALVLGDFIANEDHMAQTFRDSLSAAGVERPRLTADNPTEEPIDFRSLRDTHATWLALAGVADKIVQRRLGHASPSTTDRYVKAAETFATDNVGTPFPPLPTWPLGQGLAQVTRRPSKTPRNSVARVGFEPTTFGL
jgi:integrase